MDLQNVEKALPNHLGMGLAYWDPAGVNISNPGSGLVNGDNRPDAIYVWNGLTLFDNADADGSTNPGAPNYSAVLSALDALGGRLNPAPNDKPTDRERGDPQMPSLDQGPKPAGHTISATIVNLIDESMLDESISGRSGPGLRLDSAVPNPGGLRDFQA
jgi:hypothetical protein